MLFKKEKCNLDMPRVYAEDFRNLLEDLGIKVEDLGAEGSEFTCLRIWAPAPAVQCVLDGQILLWQKGEPEENEE